MKIKGIFIDSFGKFSNKKVEFKEGLNVIYGLNESGKSTMHSFIMSMLNNVTNEEFKRYIPWDEKYRNQFGGKIYLKLGKENVKYEKNFLSIEDDNIENNNSKNKSTIYMESHVANAIFSRQNELSDVLSSKEFIIKKIKNLNESCDEDVSITESIMKLKSFRTNIINAIESKDDDIKYKLKELENLEFEVFNKNKELYKLKSRLEYLEKKVVDIEIKNSEAVVTKDKFTGRELAELKEIYFLYQKDKEQKDKLNIKLTNNIEEINFIKNVLKEIDNDKLSEAELEYITICNEIATCKQQIQTSEVIVKDKEKIYNDFNKFLKFKNICFGSIFIILFFVSIIGFILNQIFIVGCLPCVGIIINFILEKKNVEIQRQQKVSEINEILEKKNNSIQMLNSKQNLFDEKNEFFNKINYFKDLYKRKKELEEEICLESKNIMTIEAEINSEYEKILSIVKNKFKGIEVNMANIDKIIHDIINLSDEDETSIEEMTNEIRQLKIGIVHINNDIENNVINLKKLPSRDEILYMINENDSEYENANIDIEAVNKAQEVLEECKDIIKNQYSKRVLDDVNDNMNSMTFGKYKINTIEDIIDFNTNGLSVATEDQFYLSWRIAALDVLSSNKYKLPLIVDEPFAQYDDKRLEEAMKILDNISKERQVIIFTCHKRDIDTLKGICPQKYNLVCI